MGLTGRHDARGGRRNADPLGICKVALTFRMGLKAPTMPAGSFGSRWVPTTVARDGRNGCRDGLEGRKGGRDGHDHEGRKGGREGHEDRKGGREATRVARGVAGGRDGRILIAPRQMH